MSIGDMFGKFTNMFKREGPKTDQPFLGQTTPPEQQGFFSNASMFKGLNPFAPKGGKKQTKKNKPKTKPKTKTKTKKNKK